MPTIIADRERWHYRHHPGGGGGCLLLVHGSGGSHRHWPPEVAGFQGVDVIVPDLPGHGESTGRGRDRVSDYAAALDAFCRELGLSRVTLAGHSLGGAIALSAGLSAPPWLERLVLVGTGCRLRVLPAILEGILSDTETTAEMIAGLAFGSGADPEQVRAYARTLAAVDPRITHGDFSACNGFDVCERLAQIRTPALVVSADEDRLTPVRYGRFLESRLPNAEMAVMRGVGHMMAVEDPEGFIELVQRFLA